MDLQTSSQQGEPNPRLEDADKEDTEYLSGQESLASLSEGCGELSYNPRAIARRIRLIIQVILFLEESSTYWVIAQRMVRIYGNKTREFGLGTKERYNKRLEQKRTNTNARDVNSSDVNSKRSLLWVCCPSSVPAAQVTVLCRLIKGLTLVSRLLSSNCSCILAYNRAYLSRQRCCWVLLPCFLHFLGYFKGRVRKDK